MKKSIIFAAIAASFAIGTAKAQTVGNVRLSEIRAEYIQIKTEYEGTSKYFIRLDYGQKAKRDKEFYIRDDNGKEIEFNSAIDCLNKLKNYGYELFQAYPEGSEKGTGNAVYILKRK